MFVSESLIIGVDYNTKETPSKFVLVVGRKAPLKDVEIINAFEGEEARELYNNLITKKESK